MLGIKPGTLVRYFNEYQPSDGDGWCQAKLFEQTGWGIDFGGMSIICFNGNVGMILSPTTNMGESRHAVLVNEKVVAIPTRLLIKIK